jgi:hypothetical protein
MGIFRTSGDRGSVCARFSLPIYTDPEAPLRFVSGFFSGSKAARVWCWLRIMRLKQTVRIGIFETCVGVQII